MNIYSADMNDFKLKRDELIRQAQKQRLIQVVKKSPSPAASLARVLRITIGQLLAV